LPRFGVSQPITLNVLDEPGVVAAILDRRIHFGIGLGLESDVLGGNNFWPGLLNVAGTIPITKGAGWRVTALVNAVAAVQANGFYGPLQVVVHPTTRAAIFNETDTAGRPLPIDAMLADQVDQWIKSKFVPVGTALVLDCFNAVALLTYGPLVLAASREHADFLVRAMVEWTMSFRCFAWVRNPVVGWLAVILVLDKTAPMRPYPHRAAQTIRLNGPARWHAPPSPAHGAIRFGGSEAEATPARRPEGGCFSLSKPPSENVNVQV
jgi:hypothetical protein